MRIAICISGQPRGLPTSVSFFKDNLLTPNGNPDVFIHTWYDKTLINTPFDSAQPERTNKLGTWFADVDEFYKKEINPVNLLVESPRSFDEFLHLQNRESAIQTRLASMFYSSYQANKLKTNYEEKHGFKYDVVVKTRIDIRYHGPILISNIIDSNLNTNIYVSKLYQHMRTHDSYPTTDGGSYSSLSDTFAIGSSDNIDKFCSVFEHFEDLHKLIWPYVYGEAYLGCVVRGVHQIPISEKDIPYEIYRG